MKKIFIILFVIMNIIVADDDGPNSTFFNIRWPFSCPSPFSSIPFLAFHF